MQGTLGNAKVQPGILKSEWLCLHHTAFKHVDRDLYCLGCKLPGDIKCSTQLC